MLPVTPMTSVTTSAAVDRDSKVSEITDPISSTEAPQPTEWSYNSQCSFNTTQDVPPDPPKVYHQIGKLHPRSESNTVDISCCAGFAVESVGLISAFSLLSVRTCETC